MKDYDVMENWDQIPKKGAGFDKQDDMFRYINENQFYPNQSPELNVGEHWYIKYPGATALVEVEIDQVTPKTVILTQMDLPYNSPLRYEISNIKFVEKVEKK